MRSSFIILLVFLCVASLWSQNVRITDSEASIKFVFLDNQVEGTIGGFRFTGAVDVNNLEASTFSGTVQMESLDTNNWLRNRHLRAKKYFYNKAHPTLQFSSSKVISNTSDNDFTIEGVLTIKGISKPVVWTVQKANNQLNLTCALNTADFNIWIHKEKQRNKVRVQMTLPYVY